MIIDNLKNAGKYFYLNTNFQKAFEFIKSNDLKNFDPGRYYIDGENSFVNINLDELRADVPNKLEVHRKYIDIQLALEGSFGLTWKALEDCHEIETEFSTDKDVAFFSDEADFEIMLNEGNFAILFPEDAHFPQAPKTKIKKAVLKILV